MTARDGFEHGVEVGVGFDAIELAGLDERCDAAPCASAFVMTSKERVLAVQRKWV